MSLSRSLALLLALAWPVAAAETVASVTVAELIGRAVAVSPTSERIAALRALATADLRRAGAWANPELELRAGRSRFRDGGDRVGTYGADLRQRLPLPGRRGAAQDAARAGSAATEVETVVLRRELEEEVRRAAMAQVVAEESMRLAERELRLAEEVRSLAERLHAAGEGGAAAVAQTAVEVVTAELARDRARSDADAAREALVRWTGALPPGAAISDALPAALPAPSTTAAPSDPRADLAVVQAAAADARIAAAERAWWPDLTVGVSADRAADTDDLGVSLGIELPLWDREGAAVDAARAEARLRRAEIRQQAAQRGREIAAARAAYAQARSEAEGLRTRALPAAEEALRLQLAAYGAGEANLLEVTAAKRAAIALERALLDARRRTEDARITLRSAGILP